MENDCLNQQIPASTLEAVGSLIKSGEQINRRQDDNVNHLSYQKDRKYYMDVHRNRQKLYREQMQKKKFQQMQNYHKKMQETTKEKLSRDPIANALTRLIIGPYGLFRGRKSLFSLQGSPQGKVVISSYTYPCHSCFLIISEFFCNYPLAGFPCSGFKLTI